MSVDEIYWLSLIGIIFGSIAVGFLFGFTVGEDIGWGRAWKSAHETLSDPFECEEYDEFVRRGDAIGAAVEEEQI